MLASLRRAGLAHASGPGWPVLFAGVQPGVTLAQLDQRRGLCESAADRCDVAALALGSGHVKAAENLALEAQARSHEDGDLDCVARCFHLLADAAQIEGRWDSAADHTRFALRLHASLQDIGAQTRSLAALAFQYAIVGRADLAIEGATQFLEQARAGPISRFTVVAQYALAEARRLSGRRSDATQQMAGVRQRLDAAEDMPPGSPLRVWLEARLERHESENPA